MPPLSLLIKPVSGACNLRCRYCFYRDITEKRSTANYGIMSEQTLETAVRKALMTATGECSFLFQGGEPLLAGLDFYRKLLSFQEKYNINHCKIRNSLQTNGLLLNASWATFLAEHGFLVGISLDGPPEFHDRFRVTPQGDGTCDKVLQSLQILEKHGVEYNILCVVTAPTARRPKEVYSYFKKQNLRFLQFIPCLDPYGEPGGLGDASLTPELYGNFLKKTFDLWIEDGQAGDPVSIRFFENLVVTAAGYPPESCGMGPCRCQFVLEADGGVYPCDFYVFDRWKMGNINENSWKELFESPQNQEFLRSSRILPEECKICPHLSLCRGGCRRDRDRGRGLEQNGFCSAFRDFFAYASPRICALARNL